MIVKARDGFLRKLEGLSPSQSVISLLEAFFYQRVGHSEQFLFDFGIPTFLDVQYAFDIIGEVQERKGSFRKYILDKAGIISIDRRIKFRIKGIAPKVDYFKWKVKNDDASPEPRGEITDHFTRNDPENTKYKGSHFVECYALLNNVCVAKARQDVVLNRPF
ncbi:MAG: nucleotide-binding domain-containing protein [Chloroflexota bacterium]